MFYIKSIKPKPIQPFFFYFAGFSFIVFTLPFNYPSLHHDCFQPQMVK